MFFTKRFFIALATIFVFFLLGYVFPVCFTAAWVLSCILFVLTDVDLVWGIKNRKDQGVTAHRICPGRFSNGDENEVCIAVESHLSVPIHVDIIDELPTSSSAATSFSPSTSSPANAAMSSTTYAPSAAASMASGAFASSSPSPSASSPSALLTASHKTSKSTPPTSCSTATSSWPRTTT